jgi:hypothetical protein
MQTPTQPHTGAKMMSEITIALIIIATAAIASCIYIYKIKHLAWPPIRSDGFGYYAYLPSVFIDHNFRMHLAVSNNPGGEHAPLPGLEAYPGTDQLLDKYPIGTALMMSPFFFVAHMLAVHLGFERNGYSLPYQISTIAAGIFYLSVGTGTLYATLRVRNDTQVSVMTTTLVVFATNVFHYSSYDASFSHIYSYALIAIYMLLIVRYRMEGDRSADRYTFVLLAIILGLITITRITDAVVAIIGLSAVLCG